MPLDDNCQNFDAAANCIQCYKGYDLINGICVFSTSNTAAPSDLGCKTWDWDNQICLECSFRWRFNSEGVCVALDDNCEQFDDNGVCVQCYRGY